MIDRRAMPYAVDAALRAVAIVPLRLGEPIEGPQVWTVAAEPPPHAMAKVLGMAPALQAALNCGPVRIHQVGRWIAIEVPRDDRRSVALGKMRADGLAVQIGVEPTGRRVTVDLGQPATAHALVAGQTGSGKSVALRALVWGLAQAPDEVELVLTDTDADTWRPFEQAAALRHAVVTDAGQADAALAAVVTEMELRLAAGGFDRHIVVAIDEVQTIGVGGRDAILQIATRGRKAGCHVVVATQYVRSDVLDRRLTDQLGARVLGRMQDGAAGYWAGSSAVSTLMGQGDVLVSLAGVEARCQVAWAPEGDRAWSRVPEAHHGIPAAPARIEEGVPAGPQQRSDDHEAIVWAMASGDEPGQAASATSIRQEFGVGTDRARRIRDDAQAALDMQTRATGATSLLRVSDHPRWAEITQMSRAVGG
ncbi:MAG: DUF87 domain-containing protein [Caldilineae bacterium]|nr:DUF87 domain-containing protein [Caldilineae bacterium]